MKGHAAAGSRVGTIARLAKWGEKGGELRAVLSQSIGETAGVSWLLLEEVA